MALRKKLFARFYDRLQVGYEELLGDRRPRLLAPVEGRVLELGPGTGINFQHFADPDAIEWVGVEPNPFMREQLVPRAEECGIEARFCELSGDELVAEDGSFDFVVSTIVLCSVPDPARTLAEIRRVLRPGGTFLFLEHVAAPRGTLKRRVQGALTPCWRYFADGCHLNRELGAVIDGAGFANVELESFEARLPHIWGQAVSKPR